MESQQFDPKTQQLLALFSEAKDDKAKLDTLLKAPLETLENLGITVDPAFHEAVKQGLHTLAYAARPNEIHTTLLPKNPSANAQPKQPQFKAKVTPLGIDFEKYVHVSAELWGIVVKIDHEAVDELPKGMKAIEPLAEAIGAIMAVSAAGPTVVMALLGLAYWGAILTAYVLVLPALDKGKGVYLTVTWPQIASGVSSGGLLAMTMMPIPTTVV